MATPRQQVAFLLLISLTQSIGGSDDDKYTSICEQNGGGLFLPVHHIHGSEKGNVLMIFAYFVGLIWSFMGVGIIADIFMSAIEVITSQETEVVLKDGTKTTVKVWNATVANLTLMALGSSAPEIILSVLEILSLEV
jgi:solute carrier family 8 (sodium/calcium exchanger)